MVGLEEASVLEEVPVLLLVASLVVADDVVAAEEVVAAEDVVVCEEVVAAELLVGELTGATLEGKEDDAPPPQDASESAAATLRSFNKEFWCMKDTSWAHFKPPSASPPKAKGKYVLTAQDNDTRAQEEKNT